MTLSTRVFLSMLITIAVTNRARRTRRDATDIKIAILTVKQLSQFVDDSYT